MQRVIYEVNATQVVVSDAHPEGVLSTVSDYPKNYDSRNYNATEANPNGDESAALNAAKSVYYDQLSKFYTGSASRVMWTVTLTRADGRQVMRESVGAFPDMTPSEPESMEE